MTPCDNRDCNARALTEWVYIPNNRYPITDELTLTFCGHHSDRHAHALTVSEWVCLEDARIGAYTKPYEGMQPA